MAAKKKNYKRQLFFLELSMALVMFGIFCAFSSVLIFYVRIFEKFDNAEIIAVEETRTKSALVTYEVNGTIYKNWVNYGSSGDVPGTGINNKKYYVNYQVSNPDYILEDRELPLILFSIADVVIVIMISSFYGRKIKERLKLKRLVKAKTGAYFQEADITAPDYTAGGGTRLGQEASEINKTLTRLDMPEVSAAAAKAYKKAARSDTGGKWSAKTLALYIQAAELEHPVAAYLTGEYYNNAGEYENASEYFIRAAKSGYSADFVYYKIGSLYDKNAEPEIAVRWYKKGARAGCRKCRAVLKARQPAKNK